MLQHGLKDMHGAAVSPDLRGGVDQPDRDGLAERFDQFFGDSRVAASRASNAWSRIQPEIHLIGHRNRRMGMACEPRNAAFHRLHWQ